MLAVDTDIDRDIDIDREAGERMGANVEAYNPSPPYTRAFRSLQHRCWYFKAV